MTLEKDSKIYIAGHHGLVGSAIWSHVAIQTLSEGVIKSLT